MKLASFLCPHCGTKLMVGESNVEETTKVQPLIPAAYRAPVPTPAAKVICACGHERAMHAEGGEGKCAYGKGHPMGGCECDAFHSRRRRPRPQAGERPSGELSQCARAILVALVQRLPRPSSRAQVALLAGYRQSGGFRTAMAELRAAGLMQGDSDALYATAGGVTHAGQVPAIPNGPARIRYWTERVSACAAAILHRLVQAYPHEVPRDRLVEDTGYRFSGGFRTALAELRTLGLVDGFAASKELMEA